MKYIISFFICIQTLICCQASAQHGKDIRINHPDIKIIGRVSQQDTLVVLYWSGTQVKVNFRGTSISAVLKDQRGTNFYNILIDGKLSQILQPDTTKKEYVLASGLKEGNHKLEIFKRTEWDRGYTYIYGFKIDSLAQILPKDAQAKLKIEYFGNSITAGYAIDDTSGKDRQEGIFTNHYETYAAITARHFKAEHHCTCKSGIGVMISWFPLTMPQMYDRTNPENPEDTWDFSKFTPDIVVINLLQNDSWLVNKPEYQTFKTTFGNKQPSEEYIIQAYHNFVKNVRARYPHAHIICMLGNMDITRKGSLWPGYVEKAVQSMHDKRVYTLFIPFKGTPIHPLRKDNQVMADQLIRFIETNILK